MAAQILRWISGGRWKGNKNGSVFDRYIILDQLPTDATLDGILSVGGTLRYKLKADSHVINSLLHIIVTPKMHEHFGADQSNNIVDMLALSLLREYHELILVHMIAPQVQLRI
jgi:hypothetical protein